MSKFPVSILLIFTACISSSHAQPNCDAVKNKANEDLVQLLSIGGESALKRFNELIEESKACLQNHEIQQIYTRGIEISNKQNDIWLLSRLAYKRILYGYTDVISLSDTTAFKIESLDPSFFQRMERVSDSVFIAIMQRKSTLDINFELAFRIRHMLKSDQRTKFRAIQADKQKMNSDAFWKQAKAVDSLNELLLVSIFEEYGYPGYTLVGTSGSDCYILMLHMSTAFQIKYIRLVQEAVTNGQLSANTQFLADKILYKSGKYTLYNTSWSKYCPVETDQTKRKELLNYLGLQSEIP